MEKIILSYIRVSIFVIIERNNIFISIYYLIKYIFTNNTY